MLRNIESDDLYKFRSNQSFNILDIIPRQLNPRKSNTIQTYPVKKYFFPIHRLDGFGRIQLNPVKSVLPIEDLMF